MSTLENLKKIDSALDSIANALEERTKIEDFECVVPIESWGDEILNLKGGISAENLDAKLVLEDPDTGEIVEERVVSVETDEELDRTTMTFRMTRPRDGRDGKDGGEGTKYEYIYFRGFTNEDKPSTPASGVGNDQDDYVPFEKKTVVVNNVNYELKWTDKAQGIDSVYMFEWRSERTKNGETWSDFSTPILWAKYGEKGKDGDGVQYIFALTDTYKKPANPTPGDWETNDAYQNSEGQEYIPTEETTEDKQRWTDDPEGVTEASPYCWFSIRRYRNGKWGEYTTPAIWDEYESEGGEDVTADVVVIDMDPNSAMVNADTAHAETTIRAIRGNDFAVIQNITCRCRNNEKVTCTPNRNDDESWTVSFTGIQSTSPTIYIDLEIKLSDTIVRQRTFSIYQTQYDANTVSVDIQGENLLIPCADGVTPNEGILPVTLPMYMRVGGELVDITDVKCDTFSDFSFTSDSLTIKSVPAAKTGSMKFDVTGGGETAYGYVSYTKFDTKNGTVAMYSFMINANDIVCDTRNGKNKYEVYTGKIKDTDNKITANILKYTSAGNEKLNLSEVEDKWGVFYANDPQDWSENASSSISEYIKLTDNGIEIGGDDGIHPDVCVSFQLREWIGEGTPWSTTNESDYIIWQSDNITVDIIREVAAYRFVVDPAKIHRDAKGELVGLVDNCINVGLSKDIAGDGETTMVPCAELPAGYDLYYRIDDDTEYHKLGGEAEKVALPYPIDVTDVKNAVRLYLVVDEASSEDNTIVLSEVVEVTSDMPGKSAYVGYLTDSLGVVSCDADGNPTPGQELGTTFKITNGSIKEIRTNYEGAAFTVRCEGDSVIFSDFTQNLEESTKIELTATYLDDDDIESEATAVYTIVKLKISESSTVLNFGNDSVVVPCDESYLPLATKFNNNVSMTHGDEFLTLTCESKMIMLSHEMDENGCYDFSIDITGLEFNADHMCTVKLPFVGTDKEGKTYNRVGHLTLVKLKAGESGEIWDLVLSNKTPKFNNDTDKFDCDYISGHINVWGKDDWRIATYAELAEAGKTIVYGPTELWADGNYSAVSESSFDASGNFVIYINPQEDNVDYVDLDQVAGATIGMVKTVDGVDEIIQEEQIQATYDGRDFSKFELLLSDNTIHQIFKNNEQVSVSPNEIRIIGVYETRGSKRGVYNGEIIHEHHVSGLDIYYSVDNYYSEFNEAMIPVIDEGNDGWASNDVIPIELGEVTERVDVYLVAHYDDPDDSDNHDVTLTVVDHKALTVAKTELQDDIFLYHMELPQDEIKVPVNDNGVVDPDFTVIINPILYVNDDVQSDAEFIYAFGGDSRPSSGWNTVKQFTASDFSGNNSYIWFGSLEHNLYKKCKISKEVNPVEIFIDTNIVKRELEDNLVHDSITLNVKKWNYTSNVWEDATGYKATLYYRVVGSTSQQTGETSSCPATFNLQTSAYSGINYIKFIITDINGNEKGFEEVGVITDGADGSSREVIYRAMSTEIPAGNLASYNPTPSDYLTNASYQEDDHEPTDWTDDYPGVSATNRYIYICERKRNKNTGFKWGSYSNPNLYAKYAEVEVSDEEKNEIAATVKDVILEDVNKNISDATESIANELEATKTALDNATDELTNAIASGDAEAIEQAKAALAKANSAHTLAENASDGLTTLETAVKSIGTEDSTILTLNDLQLLSIAALGGDADGKYPDDDTIYEDNVFAQNIVGLVGTFGEVKAEKLTGTTITGKTIKSGSAVNKPWFINGATGAFQLGGSDGIKYNGSGNISLGSDVEISWDSISDAVNGNFEVPDPGLTEDEVETIATRITKDTITTSYINALDVTAKNISATEITGKNIKSSTNSWYINDSGSFQLGGSNGIKFDGSGQVTFGSDVSLSWDSSDLEEQIEAVQNVANTAKTAADAVQKSLDDNILPRVTHISSSGIYTGTVEADQIKAGTIQGVTLQNPEYKEYSWSSNTIAAGDGWQLNADGSGHLGQHGITWDKYGGVTLGDDVDITWQNSWNNTVALKTELTGFASTNSVSSLQNTVNTINNNYINRSEAENIATSKAQELINALDHIPTESDWNDWFNNIASIDGTKITKKSISTEQIATINLSAANIFTGTLAAGYIDVANLTVTKAKATSGQWELENNGSATFANGNIVFNADGTWDLGKGALGYKNGSIYTNLPSSNVPWASSSSNSHGTGNYEVEIDGDIWTEKGNIFTKSGNIAAYNLYESSDMRLKTHVKDINLTVDQIADAPAFVFDWNETGKRSLGSSAQYWQEILPEGVEKNPDGYLMMQYGNISLVSLINLAREVKELKTQVASLQEELKRR